MTSTAAKKKTSLMSWRTNPWRKLTHRNQATMAATPTRTDRGQPIVTQRA